jgi:RNA polymerase sigma factor (sigma-70 family)
MDVHQLGVRFALGDDTTVAACCDTLTPMLRRYLSRLVSIDDVDDVAQVVLIELWRHRGRFDPARSLEAWALGIARKRAIDHLRANRRVTVPFDEATVRPRVDPTDRVEGAHDVRRALCALPGAQREAIALAYFGDFTQREIAERLDVPVGTIKARTARGLRRLGELLAA